MKISIFLLFFFLAFNSLAQNSSLKDGVYQRNIGQTNQLWFVVDDYISIINFDNNQFISTFGGKFINDKESITINIEFNSQNSNQVGEQIQMKLSDDIIPIKEHPQDLDGIWKISGRKIEGEIKEINHAGGRKTLKILKDGYFQWIAIDTEEKKFFGTGGGRYTFKNGVYTEEIEFFSKDSSRVGAKLEFEGKIEKDKWHHWGKSSVGKPIYEIWEKEN